MQLEANRAGEMQVLAVKGPVQGGDVPALATKIQELLNSGCFNLVIDLEGTSALCPAASAALSELAAKLGRAGGILVLAGGKPALFGDYYPVLKADLDVVLAESRGHGMALLLNRLSVRGQLLGFIKQALATTYVAPHAPDSTVTCRFVKHMQNFLVYALEPPYDGSLSRGMGLRFTMTGCGDDGLKTIAYEGQIYRFGSLKDGAPCLIVKVPDLLEIEEDRREDPRIKVRFQASYWDRARPQAKGYAVLEDISANGAGLRTSTFPFAAGAVVMLEVEFRAFKLLEPLQYEVLHVRHDGGDTVVGGKFVYVNPGDQQQIETLILQTSKW